LDIFNNYNNLKGGKILLDDFRENYKFLKSNRIYQIVKDKIVKEYKRHYNKFKTNRINKANLSNNIIDYIITFVNTKEVCQ